MGFTDVAAQLQPDQVQLLELFATMAAAAIERGELIEDLRLRNRSLEGIHTVLETVAGPHLLEAGLSSALEALREGIECEHAAIYVMTPNSTPFEHATATALNEVSSRAVHERLVHSTVSGTVDERILNCRFEWSLGSAILACWWSEANPPLGAQYVIDGAANAFRLAIERELKTSAEQETAALHRSREIERALTMRLGHELRTPLTAIRGFASTMLQTDVTWPDTEKERFTRIIEAESGRMSRLVAQLFDHSALENGTLRLEMDYCDLRLVIEEAVVIAAPSGQVVMNLSEHCTVWGDHDRLEQVFVNLIGNAIKHNRPGTEISISAVPAKNGHGVVASISDDGAGLPGDVVTFLNGQAEPFVRERGLGIRLTKGIVAAHSGMVRATSGSGGARIVIELPTEPERADHAG